MIRECQNCKQTFEITEDDNRFYTKISVPPPTWCPECRMVRRFNFRNERTLYRRKCDLCKREIISMYPAKTLFPVYCHNCWWSDRWNASEYGRDINLSMEFFKQYSTLKSSVPTINLWGFNNVNSEYSNYIGGSKNSYLSYSVVDSENIFYSYAVDKDKDCFDSSYLKNSQLCYENLEGANNYNSIYLIRSRDCIDSGFLFNCVNCQNCFLSSNLRNKKYYFNNKPLSKEEYFKNLEEFNLGNTKEVENLKILFSGIIMKSLHKFANIVKSFNATGDNIFNARDVSMVFELYESERVKYAIRILEGCRDIYDTYGARQHELLYEAIAPGFVGYLNRFVLLTNATNDVLYSELCHSSSNLFACIGLRNKQYCILNKQYTKEEYEKMVPKIIEHMNKMPYTDKKGRVYKYGEFFPPELSPFSYNETIAQEYFPLTKEEAIEQGYSWKDPEPRNYEITLKTEDIPDHIKDIKDDILEQTIECAHKGKCNEQCTEAFRIIPQELQFLRKMNLPLPRLCPNCRHYQRIKQRNPLKLWARKCQCQGQEGRNQRNPHSYKNTAEHPDHAKDHSCPNEFQTTYAPERPEIIYCEQCYLREVV